MPITKTDLLPRERRRPASLLLALAAGLLAACGAGDPVNVAIPAPPPVAVPGPTAAPAQPPPDDPSARLNALVCAHRDPCERMAEHSAGKDAAGRDVGGALYFLGHDDLGSSGGGEEGKDAARPTRESGVSLQPQGATFSALFDGGCLRYEYWRVVREAGVIVEADRVAEICNDGHGAAGIGEDEIKVGPNSVEIATSGGSNWRWAETAEYKLSPFVMRTQSWSGYWSIGSNRADDRIDWEAFTGALRWYSPACDANGDPPEEELGGGKEYEHLWMPAPALDPAFVDGGWKTARLGRCAAVIDASGGAGSLLSGAPGAASDTTVRVLAAEGGALFIEVTDDTLVAEDRLEIWTGPPGPTYDDHCIDPASTKDVVSWNVRVTDGKVTPGFGKPPATSLAVERVTGASGEVRLRVVPPRRDSLTIAYADSDGGRKIERRIATSALVDGRLATLGHVSIASGHASCAVADGALVPQIHPEKPIGP